MQLEEGKSVSDYRCCPLIHYIFLSQSSTVWTSSYILQFFWFKLHLKIRLFVNERNFSIFLDNFFSPNNSIIWSACLEKYLMLGWVEETCVIYNINLLVSIPTQGPSWPRYSCKNNSRREEKRFKSVCFCHGTLFLLLFMDEESWLGG